MSSTRQGAAFSFGERSIERRFLVPAPFQRQYCDRHRLVVLQRSPSVPSWQPCGNYHHSEEDYRWWGALMAACLRRSWAELPPHATLRVTAFGLSEDEITLAEKRLLRRLARRGVSYCWFREWQAPGVGRHLHLVVRSGSNFDPGDIGELWRDSLPPGGNGTTYAAEVRSLAGLAKYLTKDMHDGHIVLPPPEIRFIFYARRDFLVRPLTALRREVRADWRARRLEHMTFAHGPAQEDGSTQVLEEGGIRNGNSVSQGP